MYPSNHFAVLPFSWLILEQSPEGDLIDCVLSHLQPAFDHPKLRGGRPLVLPSFSFLLRSHYLSFVVYFLVTMLRSMGKEIPGMPLARRQMLPILLWPNARDAEFSNLPQVEDSKPLTICILAPSLGRFEIRQVCALAQNFHCTRTRGRRKEKRTPTWAGVRRNRLRNSWCRPKAKK